MLDFIRGEGSKTGENGIWCRTRVLKIKLLAVDRKSGVSLWNDDREFDRKLNEMIDVLGLRGLAKPGNHDEALKTAWMLFKLLAIAAFSFFAGRQA